MADLTGSVLACKRPVIEISHAEAKISGSVITCCVDCKCEVYAVPKNLNRGLIVLCIPCATKRVVEELKKGEPAVLMEGTAIGSPYEDEVQKKAIEFGEELKGMRDGRSSGYSK